MVLTTPATASEPYSAEAPSRSTSMRCTAPSGIWLMLDDSRGTAPAEIGCGAMRRPLSNTSVLPEPLPSRFTEEAYPRASLDRKCVVEGKSLAGRVHLGGRDIL